MKENNYIKIKRALISLSDKRGLVDFARKLIENEIHILSTGGTANTLKEAGIAVTDVSNYTGFPEIMGGRVKTLHPKIHGGILAVRDNLVHDTEAQGNGILYIDMVVANLYPFEKIVNSGSSDEDCIENIDIGGPSMIRSAAKNYKYVTVVTNYNQYDSIIKSLNKNDGALDIDLRQKFAKDAFLMTSNYDENISSWMQSKFGGKKENITVRGILKQDLRYGENPHQKASLYLENNLFAKNNYGIATAKQWQGKELSYNNINDGDAAFQIVCRYKDPSCVIVKHANPCGIAQSNDLTTAFKKSLSCDNISAFGGIVAFNKKVNVELAEELKKTFFELIIAPEIEKDALESLSEKVNLRVLTTSGLIHPKDKILEIKKLSDGILVQENDNKSIEDFEVVTKRAPNEKELKDLIFAWNAVKFVKSNGIVIAKDLQTLGIGAGQMSRVNSAKIAIDNVKRHDVNNGLVVASDAFFPFSDGLEICIKAGVEAVIQPGGSVNDKEVIDLANKNDVAMIFTGYRQFKH